MPFHTEHQRVLYRCSTKNSVLFGACCTSAVEVCKRHSTTENIASVQQRIQFKLAVVTSKVKSTKTPAYLHSLLSERIPIRTLRSSSRPLLDITRTKTVHVQRAFRISARSTWTDRDTYYNKIAAVFEFSSSCHIIQYSWCCTTTKIWR